MTSDLAGITCGTACAVTYVEDSTVTLTATAAAGSTFAGWSGACSGTGVCVVTMSAARSATASFTRDVAQHPLSVGKLGTGAGTVASNPAGISCGTTCAAPYAAGAKVTLTATPAAGSTFTGWSGPCNGMGVCVVTVNSGQTATASFTRNVVQHALSVSKVGTGSGTVTSNLAGISCGAACTSTYAAETTVTLTATAAADSTFAGWSGACSGTGPCAVTMSAARAATASFTRAVVQHPLSVGKLGTGTGTVTSDPAGIGCGTICAASYAAGIAVTLTATPVAGSTFTGWSGPCSGLGPCVVTVNSGQTATASFTANVVPHHDLSVTKAGTGSGTVMGDPGGISCGATCAATYAADTAVTLTASASAGSVFTGWSGACSGTGACVVTMSDVRTVGALFAVEAATAVDDWYTVDFETPLSVDAPGVLGNDRNASGVPVTATLVSDVSSGVLALNADGSFTYTPDGGFSGTDSFTYMAVNAGGSSDTVAVTLTTLLRPPTSLRAATILGNTVTLRWTPPSGGPVPTGYVLEGGLTAGAAQASLLTGPSPIFTFTAPTGSFFVRVRTIFGDERSEPSNEIRLFVRVAQPPSPPDSFIGSVDGNALALAWRNTYAGGEPTSLILDVTGAVNTSVPLRMADSATFTGVPPGTYTLALRSANGSGSSAASAPLTLTVPAPCNGTPSQVEHFLAYRVGNRINVVWDPPTSGAAPTGYVVNVSGALTGSFSTASRTLSAAVPPGSYALTVTATNTCGVSTPTAVQTVVVP